MEQTNYSTCDIYLASFLVSKGSKIETVSKEPDGRATFHMKISRELEEQVMEFFNKETRVEPLSYMETLRSLKALVRSTRIG